MLAVIYRFNKTIASATIRFIATAAIVVYKGLIPVVYQMLTPKAHTFHRIKEGAKKRQDASYILPFPIHMETPVSTNLTPQT